jgi:hypothetical protein
MPRAALTKLDFQRLDPSDAMENFLHRGDFKRSRKTGAFETITPLTPEDLANETSRAPKDLCDSVASVRKARQDMKAEREAFEQVIATPAS